MVIGGTIHRTSPKNFLVTKDSSHTVKGEIPALRGGEVAFEVAETVTQMPITIHTLATVPTWVLRLTVMSQASLSRTPSSVKGLSRRATVRHVTHATIDLVHALNQFQTRHPSKNSPATRHLLVCSTYQVCKPMSLICTDTNLVRPQS